MNKKIRNNVTIDDNGVSKKNNSNVSELFEYLNSRNFNNYPEITFENNEIYTMKNINSNEYYEITTGVELIKIVSSLHSKTIFFKNVSKNKYRNIYNKLLGNIEYLKKYYLGLIEKIENEEYMSPSHYLLARNYSSIDSSLQYASNELNKWFNLVSNKAKERVCIIHNNLSLKHFAFEGKGYLLSWDKHMVDTPVLDLYIFYKNDGYKLDFNYLLDIYNENLELLKEEKMLLNILISIPPKLEEISDEYENTINTMNTLKYIYSGIDVVNKNK